MWFDLLSQPRIGASTTFLVVVCSLFTNTNCSHKVGLQVQRNTLINNTMYITKRYKIFKPISINNNLVLKLVP